MIVEKYVKRFKRGTIELRKNAWKKLGVRGLEPPTSASQTLRASRLRHTPLNSTYFTIRACLFL